MEGLISLSFSSASYALIWMLYGQNVTGTKNGLEFLKKKRFKKMLQIILPWQQKQNENSDWQFDMIGTMNFKH